MKRRTIVTIVAGTITLFIWNAISWMILPFHSDTLNNIPEKAIQPEIMKKTMPESGVYHYPGIPGEKSNKSIDEIKQQLKNGPRITLMVYKQSPSKLFDPKIFLWSLSINLLTTIMAFIVVSKMDMSGFRSIMFTCILIGFIAVVLSDISQMVWYMYPVNYTLINASDKIIAFGLLGLLFGKYTFKGQ